MNKVISLATTSLLMLSASTMAQQNNWYIGVDVFESKVDLNNAFETVNSSFGDALSIDDSGNGASFLVGYQFTPWVAVEASYSRQHIDIIDFEAYTGMHYTYALFRANPETIAIATKLRYLTDTGFSIYAKPGIGYTISDLEYDANSTLWSSKLEVDQKNKNVHFNFEVGAEYFFTDSFSLGVAYERQFDALDYSAENIKLEKMSMDLYKASLRYYF
ncbi:porin family protein [Photobacterium sp. J15]|uniref:porin family protein n=1 Tax=Photobacterium sp. J15 TaxID=265901 RepID=UPI0007E491FD|nr:porin family protein [Photobacterium sp. J15]